VGARHCTVSHGPGANAHELCPSMGAGRARRGCAGEGARVSHGGALAAATWTRAAAAVCVGALGLAALVACSVDVRPADERPHVALTPVPDPSTSQVPAVPTDPRGESSGSQSG